ncbi:PhzF family phenazine biosynthesis protein [Dongia deserti]|uniref:PhzF family phenazine biosynthesis protein n=1 Tax=Dongia deserti TaxID=2268030 RepID=UPI000E65D1B7|nr:PhzF family phenazine biosynthesis protein [Dongia deserti]
MALKFFQVDAFASKPFAGNPAAVMPLPEWLPDETLQAIAAEHNLAETAYFVPKGQDFHLRWFTPTVEMPLCGHATLASAYIALNHLEPERDNVVFHTLSGALTVARDGERLLMDFPTRTNEPAPASEIAPVAEAIGAQIVDLRRGWTYLAVVESEDIVRYLKPDIAKIAALPLDVVVTARGAKADFVSRVFVPKFGIPEDPVTGAAHCLLVPYWAEVLERKTFFARQVSQRGGELWLRLEGDRLKMAGQAVLTVTGEVLI